MAVTDSNKIDFIGLDKESGKVILTISDHLNWEDEENHLVILQEKLNTYISFIESEEVHIEYPESIRRQLQIDIKFKFKPTTNANDFMQKVKDVLSSISVDFSTSVL